ncbi:MAG: right-handed parallel beta-helix repeat-containing protein, partial [Candidatus Cloacimonetes bacterium]|nr:right-handed parallel beta-helix repeat-containing protein [Candidatus Cloacimonadota bacterium]
LVILFLFTLYLSADTYIPEGDVSGTWELVGSPFYIEGEITIPNEETLFIEPGVDVIFNGYYKFIINGIIEATGTETDFILFTAANTTEGWHSLRFYDAPDFSHLSYCIIEYGRATGEIPDSHGGGIYCENSNPVITNCTFSGNYAGEHGGAIRISTNSNPIIEDCTFMDNTAELIGGGISCDESDPQIINCLISNNTSLAVYGQPGGAGGIGLTNNSQASVRNCTIMGNTANRDGGGIACAWGSNSIIEYCDISGNGALFGGGIYVSYADPIIKRCIVTNNSATQYDGGGVEIAYDSSPLLENCTISGNEAVRNGSQVGFWEVNSVDVKNNIIEGNSFIELVSFSNSSSLQGITYCDFFNSGTGGFFAGITGTVPAELGEITTLNANGDPSDVFMNIFLDPMFVDPANGDYQLTENSPCIDAGDPESPLDPDDTIADIGRFYFPQTGINDNEIVQNNIYLHQNYPNPFNPETMISFNISNDPGMHQGRQNEQIELVVYNLKGQKVKTLVNEQLQQGGHSIIWNGRDSNGNR